jgi:hypothetical protein
MSETDYLKEKDKIIETIINLFIFTDNKDWNKIENCFTDKVHFDMTSLGGEAAIFSPRQIVESWKQGLTPIEVVHHQAGNFKVEIKDKEAAAFCYGIAYHYLKTKSGNNIRTFVGSYDFHFVKNNTIWLIEKFKFNLKFINGNINLEKDI